MCNFLWSGAKERNKDHLVNWEVCYKTKKAGGMGSLHLIHKNMAQVYKWLWRFPLEVHSLWHKVIHCILCASPNG
jgi:hypothetical protein